MTLASLRALSSRAIRISHNNNAAFQLSRAYTAASTPAKFATIDESPRAQKQMTFGRDLSAAASNAHGELRYDWKKEEIESIYHSPIMELLYHGVSRPHRTRTRFFMLSLQRVPSRCPVWFLDVSFPSPPTFMFVYDNARGGHLELTSYRSSQTNTYPE
jgi:hypothetical protein